MRKLNSVAPSGRTSPLDGRLLASGEQTQFLAELVTRQTQRIFGQQWSAHLDRLAEAQAIMPRLFGIGAADDFRRYSRDAFERSVLFWRNPQM